MADDSSLTAGEAKKLAELEEIIDSGVKSFIAVGRALIAIRDGALFTDVDISFEGYCQKRWGFSKQRAYQLIDSTEVVENVSTMVDYPPPQNERQARILAEIEEPKKQARVWKKAVESAPKDEAGEPRITAAHVARVKAEVLGNGKPHVDKPRPSGKQRHDPRKWQLVDDLFGKLKRAVDAADKDSPAEKFSRAAHTKLNEFNEVLKEWRRAVR